MLNELIIIFRYGISKQIIFTQSSSSRIITGSNFNTSRVTNVRQPKFGLLTEI